MSNTITTYNIIIMVGTFNYKYKAIGMLTCRPEILCTYVIFFAEIFYFFFFYIELYIIVGFGEFTGKLNNNRKRKKCARYVIHESCLVIRRYTAESALCVSSSNINNIIISYNYYVPTCSGCGC